MPSYRFRYTPPAYYSLHTTCHTHGWKYLAPFQWEDGSERLHFAIDMGGQAADVTVSQGKRMVNARVEATTPLSAAQKARLREAIARSLDIHRDTRELYAIARRLDPALAKLVAAGAGRLLRSPSLFEDAAKTLFTTNCSWNLTEKMAQQACALATPAPSGRRPFPRPSDLAHLSAQALKEILKVGYRAPYLQAMIDAFVPGGRLHDIDLEKLDLASAHGHIKALPGFGDYASHHLLLLCGHFEHIPIDSVEIAYFKAHHRARKPQSFARRHYGPWGKYAWWGLKLEKMQRRQNWLGD